MEILLINPKFDQNIKKCRVFLLEIFENPEYGTKFSKISFFSPNVRKIWILVQIFKMFILVKKFVKTSILVKILEDVDIFSKRMEIFILVKILWKKSWFKKKFKISILFTIYQIFYFIKKFPKMWIFVII